MKLELLNKPKKQTSTKQKVEKIKKEEIIDKNTMIVKSELEIYKHITKDFYDKNVVKLRTELNKSYPELANKELEVNKIKLSPLGNMSAWTITFKNNNNVYLANYFI